MSGPQRYTTKRNRDQEIAAQMAAEPQPQGQPSQGLFGLIDQAARGYWKRQGEMAQGGLDQAEQGAQQLRNADPMGAANMVMGPLSYLASPISALVPTDAETYASDLPEWSKPGVAGTLGTMMAVMPGPKGARLGKGMASLAEDATAAEQAALGARLKGEAAQSAAPKFTAAIIDADGKIFTGVNHAAAIEAQSVATGKPFEALIQESMYPGRSGFVDASGQFFDRAAASKLANGPGGAPVSTTRDQALRNLTEAPAWNPDALKAQYGAMSRDQLLAEVVKRPHAIGNPQRASLAQLRDALFANDVSMARTKNELDSVDRTLTSDPTVWK